MFTSGDGRSISPASRGVGAAPAMAAAVAMLLAMAGPALAQSAAPQPTPAVPSPAPGTAPRSAPGAAEAPVKAALSPERFHFVALSSNQVPMRRGPGVSYEIAWNYVRLGMPMQVIGEVGDWLEVKDWRDSQGWVLRTHVSAERRVIVTGAATEERLLRERPSEKSEVKARVQAGVIGRLQKCESTWCEVTFPGGHQGWMQRDRLWGVSDSDGR